MNRGAFKIVNDTYIENCQYILEDGDCRNVVCENCPFNEDNTKYYSCDGKTENDVLEWAKEFITVFKKELKDA